jgi:lysine 2,3-aminomutase
LRDEKSHERRIPPSSFFNKKEEADFMENETLFNEEEEPPGSLTGLLGFKRQTYDLFSAHPPQPAPPEARASVSRVSSRYEDSAGAQAFRRRFYPDITDEHWHDWQWQIRNRIRDLQALSRVIRLSENERHAMLGHAGSLPVAITPYYASLLDCEDAGHPLRRSVVPSIDECFRSDDEADDPLAEELDSPVPGIVHRYPDRVLFLVTDFCSTYCRYCTRSRFVGHRGEHPFQIDLWEKAIAYIAANTQIRDVLLSGGDPLTLSDKKLQWLLSRLRRIPHVELLRIGTKAPVVMPQRITPELIRMLKRYHPLWISIHVTHPDEITPEMTQACARLADAGIPLGSQTVLLSGINDDLETMKKLMHQLLQVRVKPYYLYQCDPIPGSSHFRTPVERGLEIMDGLRGHTTGYAVPTYVIDAPGGGGKIPLLPQYTLGYKDGELLLRNYQGHLYRYPDRQLLHREIH